MIIALSRDKESARSRPGESHPLRKLLQTAEIAVNRDINLIIILLLIRSVSLSSPEAR